MGSVGPMGAHLILCRAWAYRACGMGLLGECFSQIPARRRIHWTRSYLVPEGERGSALPALYLYCLRASVYVCRRFHGSEHQHMLATRVYGRGVYVLTVRARGRGDA